MSKPGKLSNANHLSKPDKPHRLIYQKTGVLPSLPVCIVRDDDTPVLFMGTALRGRGVVRGCRRSGHFRNRQAMQFVGQTARFAKIGLLVSGALAP